MTPVRKRRIQAETLGMTLLEMSNKIRALQRANSEVRQSRDMWRARAVESGYRIKRKEHE